MALPAMPGMNLELVNIVTKAKLSNYQSLRYDHVTRNAESRKPIWSYGKDNVVWACKHVGPGAPTGTVTSPTADILFIRQKAMTHILGHIPATKSDIQAIAAFKNHLVRTRLPIWIGKSTSGYIEISQTYIEAYDGGSCDDDPSFFYTAAFYRQTVKSTMCESEVPEELLTKYCYPKEVTRRRSSQSVMTLPRLHYSHQAGSH